MNSGWVGVVVFIVALIVMIIVHETGHFLAARAFGIKVEEFFVGFGRRIFSWRRGETEYGLKAIPLGGYVRIAGMNPWQPISDDERPRTFGAKPAWQRAIVLVAGSATHFVMGAVLLTLLFGVFGQAVATTRIDAIEQQVAGVPSPAVAGGLAVGDRVLEVNGRRISSWEEFREIVQDSPGKPLEILVDNHGQRRTVTTTPVAQDDPSTGKQVGIIGISPVMGARREPIGTAVVRGIETTATVTKLSVLGIGRIFSPSGIKSVVDSLGGSGERDVDQPQSLWGGGREAARAAASGNVRGLMALLAQLIIFVGVINLVPLPPLDGGHLVVLLLEKIRGKPVDMKKVVPVAAVVMSFLVLFMVALIYLDIVRPVRSLF
jgi:membrane-associated protease RseP (regulator of RpoE activity)